jgi:hypothetical protein
MADPDRADTSAESRPLSLDPAGAGPSENEKLAVRSASGEVSESTG